MKVVDDYRYFKQRNRHVDFCNVWSDIGVVTRVHRSQTKPIVKVQYSTQANLSGFLTLCKHGLDKKDDKKAKFPLITAVLNDITLL